MEIPAAIFRRSKSSDTDTHRAIYRYHPETPGATVSTGDDLRDMFAIRDGSCALPTA